MNPVRRECGNKGNLLHLFLRALYNQAQINELEMNTLQFGLRLVASFFFTWNATCKQM